MAARASASQWLPGELSAPAGRALMPSAGQRAKKMGPSPNSLLFTASQGLVGEVWRLCPLFLFKKKKKKKRHFFQLLEQSRQSHPCLKNAIQIWSAICGMFSPRVKYFCFLGKEFMPITAWLSQRSRYSRYHLYHTTVRWQSWAERSVLNKSVVLTEMVVVTGSM